MAKRKVAKKTKTAQRVKRLIRAGGFKESDFPKNPNGTYKRIARDRAKRWVDRYDSLLSSPSYSFIRRDKKRARELRFLAPEEARTPTGVGVFPVRVGQTAKGHKRAVKRITKRKDGSIAVHLSGRAADKGMIVIPFGRKQRKLFEQDPRRFAQEIADSLPKKADVSIRVGRGRISSTVQAQHLPEAMEEWHKYVSPSSGDPFPLFFEGLEVLIN